MSQIHKVVFNLEYFLLLRKSQSLRNGQSRRVNIKLSCIVANINRHKWTEFMDFVIVTDKYLRLIYERRIGNQ